MPLRWDSPPHSACCHTASICSTHHSRPLICTIASVYITVAPQSFVKDLFDSPVDCVSNYGKLHPFAWAAILLAVPIVLSMCCLFTAPLARLFVAKIEPGSRSIEATTDEIGFRSRLCSFLLPPHVCHALIWVMLVVYPMVCRTYTGLFLCVSDGYESYYSTNSHAKCFYQSVAWYWQLPVHVVGCCYTLGLPTAFWFLARKYRSVESGSEESMRRRRRVSLLVNSYTEACWWYESADLARKLLLTGVVLYIEPGDMTQLWFGLVVSTIAFSVTLKLEPCVPREI